MPKEINYTPRQKLKKGLDSVVDTVKLTIGAKGRNVAIEGSYEPLISNDGGTIAREIVLKDKVENMGAQIVRGVIRKTSEKVGGGRTASAILTQALVTEGLKQAEFGVNMQALKRGMGKAVEDITTNLKKNAQKVTTKGQLESVATISTENPELGKVIADVVWKTGKDSIVTVEESQGLEITTDIVDGIKFDKGWVSPYMVTAPERMEAVLKDVPVLVTDKKISQYKEIFPIIEKIGQGGQLLVICEDFEGDALNNSVMMKLKGVFNLVAVKYPLIGKDEWLEDIAKSVGTEVVSNTGVTMDKVELGLAKKIIVGKESTVIMGSTDIKGHLRNLKLLAENTDNLVEKDKLERRIAILSGGIAIIKVGASTEMEAKYLKQKIEDGVNEAKRALEEGIVAGGDVAYIHATKGLGIKGVDEETIGYNLVLKAVEAPFKQILTNANAETEVILNEIKKSGNSTGYDVLTNKVVDMLEVGIIDALKVVRTTLENALSGAIMFLSIEASISEETEKEKLEY